MAFPGPTSLGPKEVEKPRLEIQAGSVWRQLSFPRTGAAAAVRFSKATWSWVRARWCPGWWGTGTSPCRPWYLLRVAQGEGGTQGSQLGGDRGWGGGLAPEEENGPLETAGGYGSPPWVVTGSLKPPGNHPMYSFHSCVLRKAFALGTVWGGLGGHQGSRQSAKAGPGPLGQGPGMCKGLGVGGNSWRTEMWEAAMRGAFGLAPGRGEGVVPKLKSQETNAFPMLFEKSPKTKQQAQHPLLPSFPGAGPPSHPRLPGGFAEGRRPGGLPGGGALGPPAHAPGSPHRLRPGAGGAQQDCGWQCSGPRGVAVAGEPVAAAPGTPLWGRAGGREVAAVGGALLRRVSPKRSKCPCTCL